MFEDEYAQLLVELNVCDFGGLVCALVEAPTIAESVISRIRKDMPQRFNFSLELSPEKKLFPIYFSQSFETLGKEPVIFHVVGLESLPEKEFDELILNLQHYREAFKKDRYILVFWISKKLERRLFYQAPDFYHWILGVYDFTVSLNLDLFSDAARLQQEEYSHYHKCILRHLEKAVWQYENWHEADTKKVVFVNDVISRTDLSRNFVRLYGTTKDGSKIGVREAAEDFLENEISSFFALLGEYGTGKSSFALHFYIVCARRFLRNSANRIPIFVCLKDYPQRIELMELIREECFRKVGAQYKLYLFQKLAVEGKFLFILDGFDEISSIVDRDVTIYNFRELTKLSFETVNFLIKRPFALNSSNKVLVTCRTNYFFSEDQERNILSKDSTRLYRDYVTKQRFSVFRVTLALFDRKQVAEFLRHEINDAEKERELMQIIHATYNLLELCNRPLLLKMVASTLPQIRAKKRIRATDLYRAYTDSWILREDWRSTLSPDEKRHWMWKLASEFFVSLQSDGMSLKEIAREIDKRFPKQKDLDILCQETVTCSFLTRESSGGFRFVHKSFMEFFVAEYEASCIFAKKASGINRRALNKETMFFMSNLIDEREEDDLSGLDLSYLEISDITLKEKLLDNTNLSGAKLIGVRFDDSSLSCSAFERAQLIDVVFCNCNIKGANFGACKFRDTVIADSCIEGAVFESADFSGERLTQIDFSGLNMSFALFRGACIRNTEFKETDLHGASFALANGKETSFLKAKMEGCHLEYADFSKADFGWASLRHVKATKVILKNANLGAAVAISASFESADLEGANLEATDLSYAILGNANLVNARVSQETVTSNVDFFGANLAGTGLEGSTNVRNRADWIRFFNYP